MKANFGNYRCMPICILASLLAAAQVFSLTTGVHKWKLDFGAGVTPTLDSTRQRLATGWNFTAGGGYNFNGRMGVTGQAMYDGLGVTKAVLDDFAVPGANSHIWGLTLNPVVRFRTSDRLGFYQRKVNFTQLTTAFVTVYDPFFGFFFPAAFPAKEIIGRNTRVDWGDAGLGVTYKLGHDGAKFSTEVRYHYIETSRRATPILSITFGVRW